MTWHANAPICHSASGVSGCPAHAPRSGQIGSPAWTTSASVAHFRKALASLHAFHQIGDSTCKRPAVLWISSATCHDSPLICPARQRRRGLRKLRPSRLPARTNQPTKKDDQRPDRPIERAVRFAPVPSQIGGFTQKRQAFSPALWRNFALDALIGGLRAGRQGFRPLSPPAFAETTNQRSFPDSARLCRPLFVSSLESPARLRTQRVGSLTLRPTHSPTPEQSLAPDAQNCGHCSGRLALRFLGPSAIADAAMQRSFPELSESIRPFFPSSLSLKPRLRAQRIDGLTPVIPDQGRSSIHQIPRSDVIQDSDFPRGNHPALFAVQNSAFSGRQAPSEEAAPPFTFQNP